MGKGLFKPATQEQIRNREVPPGTLPKFIYYNERQEHCLLTMSDMTAFFELKGIAVDRIDEDYVTHSMSVHLRCRYADWSMDDLVDLVAEFRSLMAITIRCDVTFRDQGQVYSFNG